MGIFDFLKRIFGPGGTPPAPRGASRAPTNGRTGAPSAGTPSATPSVRAHPSRAQGTESPRAPWSAPSPDVVAPPAGDLGRFAPLTRNEASKQAAGRSLRGGAWFGRRDRIPPASDPRTNLIDRLMVGEGYTTPEELAEIHEIGDRMEALDPVDAGGLAAIRALDEDRAARAARKAALRAAAEERRRKHAEGVAHRRAADIIFLGAGVSSGLADRRAHPEKLTASGLPILAAPSDIATALGLTIGRLRWLAFHSEAARVTHYVRFTVPKRSGGTRELAAPHASIAAAQTWILRELLDRLPVHAAAHGFARGRSTVTNAAPHAGRAVVVNADLKDFFPSITFPRVRGALRGLGYSPAAATVLALLATEAPRRVATVGGETLHVATGPRSLPQGACTSPALSNLIARRLDARLAGMARKLGFTYTRYADDLTFSGDAAADANVGRLLAWVRRVVEDEGFAMNDAKTRIQRRNTAQSVTGIVVNERPGVSRDVVRRVRSILHHAKREGLAAQNREGREHFDAWVRGMVAYIHMVNPRQGEPLRAALDSLGA